MTNLKLNKMTKNELLAFSKKYLNMKEENERLLEKKDIEIQDIKEELLMWKTEYMKGIDLALNR